MTTTTDTTQREIATLQAEVRHLALNIERLTSVLEKQQADHEGRIRRLERAVLALMAGAALAGSAVVKAFGLI